MLSPEIDSVIDEPLFGRLSEPHELSFKFSALNMRVSRGAGDIRGDRNNGRRGRRRCTLMLRAALVGTGYWGPNLGQLDRAYRQGRRALAVRREHRKSLFASPDAIPTRARRPI